MNTCSLSSRPVGLAMYTVHTAAARDLAGTFQQLADMGYRGIEFYGDFQQFNVQAIRSALESSGLEMWGWHVEWRAFQPDRLNQTIDTLHAYRCPVAVVPCLGGRWEIGHSVCQENLERWLRYADELSRLNLRMKREGIALGYHNHDHEFSLRYVDKPVFYWLFDYLPPDFLMELDTGNCIEGGGNPVDVLERYAGRKVLLHMKPYSFLCGFNVTLGEKQDANDWSAILQAKGACFERIMVESEAEHLPEMENARLCLQGWNKQIR